MRRLARLRPVVALAAVACVLLSWPREASAVYECGGEFDTCPCGRANYCLCDGTCGNCVWHAWHSACCNWDRALEWCTDGGTWDEYARSNGYPTGSNPVNGCIFVCNPSGTCSEWGHAGWVVTAFPDGSFDSTEQYWGGPCGTHSRHRDAGFATAGFIYNPSGTPVETDDAEFVSETVPDGTHFRAGAPFTKRWTMRNTGTSTWTRGANFVWTWDGDERFGAAEQTLLPDGTSVAPGATRDWDVAMTAPGSPGTYRGYWRMDHVGTGRFGRRVWVEIVVDSAPPPDGDGDGYASDADCDDGNPSIHPGASETCNGRDDDCDSETDEGVRNRCGSCGPEPAEVCDGADNDCDGATDEDCVGDDPAPDAAGDAPADVAGNDSHPDLPDGLGLDVPAWEDRARPLDGNGHPGSGDGGGCGCTAAGGPGARPAFFIALAALALGLRRRRGR